MGFLDAVGRFLALPSLAEPVQTRSEVVPSTLEEFVNRIEGNRMSAWRIPSVREAMAVPAVFGAVALISNTTGSLTMKGYRRTVELPDEERPQLIVRPNPRSTPRDFWRDTAYYLATRGEAWWWIAKRDPTDLGPGGEPRPAALYPIHPREIIVTAESVRDRLRPRIEWLGTEMDNEDMVQITYQPDPEAGGLRGFGPLQACQAAISVAVEANEWAANFYGDSGYPSVLIKHAGELSGEEDEDGYNEADRLRNQWIEKPNNVPRVIDQNIESVTWGTVNTQGAQMLEARAYSAVEVAQMFNMPAPMIEAAVAGGSLTYQNITSLFDAFVKRCLRPNFLEPIEQAMSDLLTRSTVGRFNTDAIVQDDLGTRATVYQTLTAAGLPADDAARRTGFAPVGDVENAPVPFSPPAAVPTSLPVRTRAVEELRCSKPRADGSPCGQLIGRNVFGGEFKCKRCGSIVTSEPVLETRTVEQPSEVRTLAEAVRELASRQDPSPIINIRTPDMHYTAPNVNVTTPDVHVTTPDVHVTTPEIRMPDIVLPAQEPPVVNVDVQPSEAPAVTVNVPEPRPSRKRIERDSEGRPTALVEESV